jgi:hypothetical protein
MYYLRDLEERIDEYRRSISLIDNVERVELLEDLRAEEAGGIKRWFATLFVQVGFKLDREAAEDLVAARQAA